MQFAYAIRRVHIVSVHICTVEPIVIEIGQTNLIHTICVAPVYVIITSLACILHKLIEARRLASIGTLCILSCKCEILYHLSGSFFVIFFIIVIFFACRRTVKWNYKMVLMWDRHWSDSIYIRWHANLLVAFEKIHINDQMTKANQHCMHSEPFEDGYLIGQNAMGSQQTRTGQASTRSHKS